MVENADRGDRADVARRDVVESRCRPCQQLGINSIVLCLLKATPHQPHGCGVADRIAVTGNCNDCWRNKFLRRAVGSLVVRSIGSEDEVNVLIAVVIRLMPGPPELLAHRRVVIGDLGIGVGLVEAKGKRSVLGPAAAGVIDRHRRCGDRLPDRGQPHHGPRQAAAKPRQTILLRLLNGSRESLRVAVQPRIGAVGEREPNYRGDGVGQFLKLLVLGGDRGLAKALYRLALGSGPQRDDQFVVLANSNVGPRPLIHATGVGAGAEPDRDSRVVRPINIRPATVDAAAVSQPEPLAAGLQPAIKRVLCTVLEIVVGAFPEVPVQIVGEVAVLRPACGIGVNPTPVLHKVGVVYRRAKSGVSIQPKPIWLGTKLQQCLCPLALDAGAVDRNKRREAAGVAVVLGRHRLNGTGTVLVENLVAIYAVGGAVGLIGCGCCASDHPSSVVLEADNLSGTVADHASGPEAGADLVERGSDRRWPLVASTAVDDVHAHDIASLHDRFESGWPISLSLDRQFRWFVVSTATGLYIDAFDEVARTIDRH